MKPIYTQNKLNRTLTIPALAVLGLVSTGAYANTRITNGDFNGDGYNDIVVGIPNEDVGNTRNAGAISVFYGKKNGLHFEPTIQIHQDSPNGSVRAAIKDVAEADDKFGDVLAVADFNNDGFDDLAVGVPGEDTNGDGHNNGAVHILYGSIIGIHGFRNSLYSLESMGYFGYTGGRFGSSLAVGDIDRDGNVDLAIGIPGHDAYGENQAGAVMVLYSGPHGFKDDSPPTQLIMEGYPMLLGKSQSYDYFGSSLAMDDFNQDGYADLAIGVPGQSFVSLDGTTTPAAGSVQVLYGGDSGILGYGNNYLIDVDTNSFDRFGTIMASGDFNGDGYPELAVGHPHEDSTGERFRSSKATDSGLVTVFFSDAKGLSQTNRQFLRQGFRYDKQEDFDHFGSSLAVGDFNGDGIDDLAVGTPHEDHERRYRFDCSDVGQVNTFYGSTNGLLTRDYEIWDQDKTGVSDKREGNRFGQQLGAGDYNNDGFLDLVVGTPGEDVRVDQRYNQKDAGILHVFYGQSDGLSISVNLGRKILAEPRRTSGTAPGRAETNDGFGG